MTNEPTASWDPSPPTTSAAGAGAGVASGGDYTRPGDWTSPLQAACNHSQDAQGAALARAR